ncbi:MAG: HEAT repeat domain-containing protein [Planctomycetota bacterium]
MKPETVERHIKSLRDTNPFIRGSATLSLKKIGKPALELLKPAFEKEKDKEVKQRIKDVIEQIRKS